MPSVAAVYHPQVFPVGLVNVGNVIATAVQFAVNVTVPLDALKSLNQTLLTFVEASLHAVVTLVLPLPYLAVEIFKLLSAVQPANVCVLLFAAPILAPVPLAEPLTVTFFVGLSILSTIPNVPVVG